MRRYCFFIAAALLVIVFSQTTLAATLFSTIGQLDHYVTSSTFANHHYASDFRTGTDASTITALLLPLRNQDTIQHNIRAAIHLDSAGVPGAVVAEFDNTISLPAGESAFTSRLFTTTGIDLDAEANFWVIMRQLENGTSSSNNLDVDMTGNFANGVDPGSFFSTVSTTSVQNRIGFGAWGPFAGGNLRFALEGIVTPSVPEPSCLMMLGTACLGTAYFRCLVRR
ncbi:MAG: hypothetical protein IT425_07695 [Pirellulales bacterium]|nr:hypothetical protein [Pirellulales bacterium]